MTRWIIIGGLAVTLALTGCSKSDPAQDATPTTAKSDSGDTPTTKSGGNTTATFSLNDCLAVATGNLGVIGGNKEAADKVKAFKPPSDVSDAIDLLIDKGGIKIDGSNQDEVLEASKKLTDWVEAVCPKSS